MRRSSQIINTIVIAGGVTLLIMSLWPGYAGGCMFLLALPLIGLLGLAWLIVVMRAATRSAPEKDRLTLRQVLLAPILVCLTLALLQYYVPRRIAFAFVKNQFDAYIPTAATSQYSGAKLNRWIGMYHVDEYASDPRGGVYFRTGAGPDGIGPDTMSYGFVYQPNLKGTPFGAAHYKVRPLGRDWYWFQASNDWY